jgi:hypothetical protein
MILKKITFILSSLSHLCHLNVVGPWSSATRWLGVYSMSSTASFWYNVQKIQARHATRLHGTPLKLRHLRTFVNKILLQNSRRFPTCIITWAWWTVTSACLCKSYHLDQDFRIKWRKAVNVSNKPSEGGKPVQEPCSPGNRILSQSTVEVHSIKSAYTASQPPVLSNLPCHKQGAVKRKTFLKLPNYKNKCPKWTISYIILYLGTFCLPSKKLTGFPLCIHKEKKTKQKRINTNINVSQKYIPKIFFTSPVRRYVLFMENNTIDTKNNSVLTLKNVNDPLSLIETVLNHIYN